jgi:hypothetical protein
MAARWYENGWPGWTIEGVVATFIDLIDYDVLGDFWRETETERANHARWADEAAQRATGYVFSPNTMHSDAAAAADVVRRCVYDSLEAAAKLRRIEYLAGCLRDGDVHYEAVAS